MTHTLKEKTTSATMRESALFEFYASHVWPIHRLFAKKYLTPRCTKCALSARAITLNDAGVCSLCTTNTDDTYVIKPERQAELEEELHTIFSRYAGAGTGEYDALIMISGGKDSTLLIHKLRTEYPSLRVLTITIDNSFMSAIALRNVDKIVEAFNTPHIRLRPNPDIYRTAFKYAFTHLGTFGCAQTVDTVDGELFLDFGKHIAATFKIPLLVTGFSFEQVTRYLHWNSFHNTTYDTTKRMQVGIYTPEELLPPSHVATWWDPSRYASEHIPQIICPFYVWRMNEVVVEKEVAALGLLDTKETSPLVTNNQLIPLCGLVDIAHLGYSSWEPEFSRMVREGKTDKKKWQNIFELMEYSAKTGKFISSSVDVVLEKLGLTRADVGIR
ncbi:hypothetical protein IPH92_03305 [Candidatus Kaiserbacteria bacterium]|nr:MAG: hypothetical protein IPH92_03305 [Candidatus Kaiserbacteria bacterium]